MKKAIFLDRDGVINKEIGDYVCNVSQFEILPHVPTALKIMQDLGYILIVITNQGGIAKGLYTHTDLDVMHQKMKTELAEFGVDITEIYYSPHHPHFSGKSLSRKPESMLLEKAIARFNIDPNQSFLIGDNQRDIEAAEKVGVKGFLIKSNTDFSHFLTDFT